MKTLSSIMTIVWLTFAIAMSIWPVTTELDRITYLTIIWGFFGMATLVIWMVALTATETDK